MKNKIILLLLLGKSFFLFSQNNNVGINTITPDPSAILEVSANASPSSTITTKKGLLLPRVALRNAIDVTTIPNPANGLMVLNTADNGAYPNQVSGNHFYYWNGTKWTQTAIYEEVLEAVKPRIFYVESNEYTSYTSSQINNTDASLIPSIPLTFAGNTAKINSKNFIDFNAAAGTYQATVTGLYEISAFVNYNPMNVGQKLAMLNLIIQRSTNGGVTWTDILGTRTGYGDHASSSIKTANIYSLPVSLSAGNYIRVVIRNPFNSTDMFHAQDGNAYIGTAPHLPISKGVRIQLLDFNL